LKLQGDGNATFESCAIGVAGGVLVALAPGIADALVFMGKSVRNVGGNTVHPLLDSNKFSAPTLDALNWRSGADVRLGGDTVIAAIDGGFSLPSTLAGNGNAGHLILVDAPQQSFLNTTVYAQSGCSDYRIALESTITGSAGGPESFMALAGIEVVSAIPEPETVALLLSGLGLVGWVSRRRQRISHK
jgi:hypothetical protein